MAMQIFAAVGPLGVGKTTFVLNVIHSLESGGFPTKERVAYVVNDEGSLIDGELASKSAEVVAMTNGCFTCSDTADLKRILTELEQSGISWVFLEGFGITAGNETRQFLESCPYPFHIFSLLSAQHHALDLIRYADVVKSQVGAATLAVGVTKHEGNLFELETTGILEFVAKENPGIPLVLVTNNSHTPGVVIDIFEEKIQNATQHTGMTAVATLHHDHAHHADCGCAHAHHDHSHHVHDMYPYFYELAEGATLDNLRRAFESKDFVLRIKGAVDGRLFNEVHGDWEQTVSDSRRFVTFYASREVDIAHDLPGLATLVVTKEEETEEEPAYRLIRKETATREETVQEIIALLDGSPREPVVLNTARGLRVITHPEKLQNAKEISRRPYVIDEWFPQVLRRFMEYWIKCADVVITKQDKIVPEDIAKNRYELAVSMVWWVNRFGAFFGPEIVQAVERAKPGSMVARGVRCLKSLIPPGDDGIAWQCREFTEALSYGLAHGDCSKDILSAARHCLSLATTPELTKAWTESIEKLEKEATEVLS
jgi:G3E family GTPase